MPPFRHPQPLHTLHPYCVRVQGVYLCIPYKAPPPAPVVGVGGARSAWPEPVGGGNKNIKTLDNCLVRVV